MDRLSYLFIVLCVIVIKSSVIATQETESITLEPSETLTTISVLTQDNDSDYENDNQEMDNVSANIGQRSITSNTGIEQSVDNTDRHTAFRKRAKPLKSIFMDIYKNYKSTYLGNKTFAEYKRTLRKPPQDEGNIVEENNEKSDMEADINDKTNYPDESQNDSTEVYSFKHKNLSELESESASTLTDKESKIQSSQKNNKKQRNRKRSHRRKKHKKRYAQVKKKIKIPSSPIYNYDFGPGVNMSLDMNNELVHLHLERDNLREMMQGRWLKGRSEGRGKKYEMITRVLPLFIIPFLIQSAVVPFIVTKLKLLLMKSILVGKLAIFLIIISAIKNSNKMMQTYEVAPSYWAGEPSRRSELTAAASGAPYNGYRVEGKPTAWIN